MKTINVKDVKGVKFNGGKSYRTVLEKDGLGFAMMETRIDKGGWYKWHYKNHKEACMCISGHGIVHDLSTDTFHDIFPGTTYLVDNHQPHLFKANTDVILVSVFNPPLTGKETHDKEGSYELNPRINRSKAIEIVCAVNNADSDFEAIERVENLI